MSKNNHSPTAPHDCDVPGCPGPENKRKLEAFDDLLAALDSTCPPEQSDLDSDGMGECIWCHVAVNVDNGDDQCQQPECPGVKARAAIAKAKGA